MCTNKHYELEGCKIHKTSSLPERKLLTKEVVALYLLVSSPVLFFCKSISCTKLNMILYAKK